MEFKNTNNGNIASRGEKRKISHYNAICSLDSRKK